MAITLGTDGYCVIADVQALHQQRTFTTTTKPTIVQTEAFITQGFQNINAVLEAIGYTIPVAVLTYTESAGVLLTINVNYALFRVAIAAYSAGVGLFPESATAYREDYNTALQALKEGTMKLPDAPLEPDFLAAQNERDPEGEFNVDDDGEEQAPVFARDSKVHTGRQW